MKKTNEKAKALIYLGPNLPDGRLSGVTVFRGAIPEHLNDLRERHPEIDELIVPVSETTNTLQRVASSGTPEYAAYHALTQLSRKEA